jgi:hypothetical protein
MEAGAIFSAFSARDIATLAGPCGIRGGLDQIPDSPLHYPASGWFRGAFSHVFTVLGIDGGFSSFKKKVPHAKGGNSVPCRPTPSSSF